LLSDQQPGRAEVRIALGELNKLSEKLSVPGSVTDEAARIYTRSLSTGLSSGRSGAQIAAISESHV
jgi:transcription initiation factor TFIIIB Brf1 subunit/transcription initiation factor TFIIB